MKVYSGKEPYGNDNNYSFYLPFYKSEIGNIRFLGYVYNDRINKDRVSWQYAIDYEE